MWCNVQAHSPRWRPSAACDQGCRAGPRTWQPTAKQKRPRHMWRQIRQDEINAARDLIGPGWRIPRATQCFGGAEISAMNFRKGNTPLLHPKGFTQEKNPLRETATQPPPYHDYTSPNATRLLHCRHWGPNRKHITSSVGRVYLCLFYTL